MRSMTGYGQGVTERGGVRVTIDVRAVNHRFLDLKLRGAPLSAALEDAIAARVRSAVERGAVTVTVHLARIAGPSGLRVDDATAARAHRLLSQLATRLGMQGPDLALVLAQPGVVTGEDAFADDDAAREVALEALGGALAQLDTMRTTEGDALAIELHARLDELVAMRSQIAVLAAELPQLVARRLGERIKRLADDAGIEPARLAQEVALLADRADITEELVRLASHLDQARALLSAAGSTGRKLDFLIQELGRELNTIGAKSATAEITTLVVGAKSALEKIREQAQNVE